MKLGFTSIYSWRPHVEQVHYLAKLARRGGHETAFLTCDSDLPTCYTRQMRPHRAQIVECTACRLGGIRSYVNENISSLADMTDAAIKVPMEAGQWVLSSASTLGRFESDADYADHDFYDFAEALRPAVSKTYAAARSWIEREKLDGLFFFNGRMDVTRAIMEAAKDAKIPFVSVERTWFGDGIQLLPNESCLGLSTIDNMVAEWRDRPLTRAQALAGASHIAARFLRRNQKEWRAYNVNAKKSAWPVKNANHRLLLLPSSRNESWGLPEWQGQWPESIAAYDALIDHFRLRPQDLVLRCHPNWGENIGRTTGAMSEDYYTAWTKKRGILCIPSKDSTSTLGLIEEADAIVVSGGSAALEAGALGKQVIALSPSWYQKAGFQTTVYSNQDLAALQLQKDMPPIEQATRARDIQKRTLRFCYTIGYRMPQFVPFVRSITTTEYNYFDGANPAQLTRLIETGVLEADDDRFAPNDEEENGILDLIAVRNWEKLSAPMEKSVFEKLSIHRRHIYQAVDWVRAKMRRGDLG
jgi:hypothetical protein